MINPADRIHSQHFGKMPVVNLTPPADSLHAAVALKGIISGGTKGQKDKYTFFGFTQG